jgi:hypothetical protein
VDGTFEPIVLIQVAAEVSEPPAWYTATSGILAIPITVLSAVGSYYLIQKMRRESRKLDLEIIEKQRQLQVVGRPGEPATVAEIIAEPLLHSRRAQDIILRFILLFLVLQVWGVVRDVAQAATIGMQAAIAGSRDGISEVTETALHLVTGIVVAIPEVGYWVLFVALGFPLLLDICEQLRIGVPEKLKTPGARRAVLVVAALAAVVQALAGPIYIAFLSTRP